MVSARIPACPVRLLLAFALAWAAGASPARADEGSAVDQIVAVLKQKGLIDDATGDEILAKQAKADAAKAAEPKTPSVAQALTEGWIWSGDLRLRDEQFWYAKGLQGVSADDNNRIRYRVRFGFTKQVNPWALIGVRVVTDTTDYRSTNITVGQTPDFSYDDIFLDQAYVKFAVPDPGVEGLKTAVFVGKFANPFVWRQGLDKLLWDEDITPEGVAVTPTWQVTESTKIWANLAYFVELQQASLADPRVWAYQLAGSQKFGEMFELAARVSYYDWENLQNDPNTPATPSALATNGFFARTFANGNQPIGFNNGGVRFLESSGYLIVNAIEDWPLLFWGTWIGNLTGHGGVVNGVSVSAQNNAWGLGMEFGDMKKWARLGVEYQWVEANGVIAEFTDSDMFDGRTNRRGFGFYGLRELAENTELKVSLWEENAIKTTQSGVGGGPYNLGAGADSQANRSRLQVDVNFKY